MSAILKAVIFDHSTLLGSFKPQIDQELKGVMEWLKSLTVKIVVFSTHPQNINSKLVAKSFPMADLVLTRRDVGANKGSDAWVKKAASTLGLELNEFLYIGDDERDWRSAINAGVFYGHAKWANSDSRLAMIGLESPDDVREIASHFLLVPSRIEYALDIPSENLYVRCLLKASAKLTSSKPSSFTLQDVFTYENQVSIGKYRARDLLMLHAISSLYLEGLLTANPIVTLYPSSNPAKVNDVLQQFVAPSSKMFHGYFKDDMLVRGVAALDTSRARARENRTGVDANVTIKIQTDSVHINPRYEGKLDQRTVIVIDDFTTSGMSLDWARNLLRVANAEKIILLTIGKYGYTPRHEIYKLKPGLTLNPYKLSTYDIDKTFVKKAVPMVHANAQAESVMNTSFAAFKDGLPYPI